MTTPVRDDDLELRLRRDAPRWGGSPSPAARAALRARLATLPRAHAPRWPLVAAALAAAAALVTAAILWQPAAAEPQAPPVEPPVVQAPTLRAFDVGALEAKALAPLRAELAGLARDGELLARGMWRQVPEPVRRLLE